jgi:hypothetical protein
MADLNNSPKPNTTNIKCAADYNSDKPCCGQPIWGNDLENKCPEDKPICTGYIANKTWGNCVSQPSKYKDLGPGCCTGPEISKITLSSGGGANTIDECQERCDTNDKCTAFSWGWDNGNSNWCSTFTTCSELDNSPTGCGSSGNDGVHSYQRQRYNCITNPDGSTNCLKSPNGKYNSLKECKLDCNPKYMCNTNNLGEKNCIISKNGNFTSLKSCQENCKTKFTCDKNNNICKIDKNGIFSNVEMCQNACKPQYSCNLNNYQCYIDPKGSFSSSAECTESCRAPFLIPESNITKKDLNNELNIQKDLNASINSDKLRLDSRNMQFIFYLIFTIIVIGLIIYFIVNNRDNLFVTIISIICSLIIIFFTGNYVLDNYNQNVKKFVF